MGGDSVVAAASVAVALIAAGSAELSRRAAAKAASRNTETTSRTDLEKEAFERAKDYYGDAMNRQDRELARQDEEITGLHAEVDELRSKVRVLELDLALSENHVRTLSAALAERGDTT